MSNEPTIGQLISSVLNNISGLIRGEIDLVKAQAKAQATAKITGIVLFAAAALFGLFGFGWLLITGYQGLLLVVQPWAAALIVAGVLLLIAAILGLAGKKALSGGPEITVKENLERDIAAIKEGASL